MRIIRAALACLTLLLIVGCGGNGNDSRFSGYGPLVDRLVFAADAINDEDLNDLANSLSEEFYDECLTEEEFLAQADDVFDDPDVDLRFRIDNIRDVDINQVNGTGTVTYDYTIFTTVNGVTDTEAGTSTDLFVLENNRWLWAGNQECPNTFASRKRLDGWRQGE